MGVKWPKKGAKWRLLPKHATLLFMTQLLCCHVVAFIVVQKSAERQIATTTYSLRTCVENMTSPTKLNVRSDSLTGSYSPSDIVLARTFVTIRSYGRCFLFLQFGPHTPPGLLSETSNMVSQILKEAEKRSISGMVQKRRFSGNTRNLSADPDRSRVGAGFRESLAAMLGLQFRENRVYPRSSSQ